METRGSCLINQPPLLWPGTTYVVNMLPMGIEQGSKNFHPPIHDGTFGNVQMQMSGAPQNE